MALEQALSLKQAERKTDVGENENTWNYRLSNVSVDNVRSIVTNPEVVDTHFIDRSSFKVEAQPPPGDHQALGVVYATMASVPGNDPADCHRPAHLGSGLPRRRRSSTAAAGSFRAGMEAPFHRYALPFALLLIPFRLLVGAADALAAGAGTDAARGTRQHSSRDVRTDTVRDDAADARAVCGGRCRAARNARRARRTLP